MQDRAVRKPDDKIKIMFVIGSLGNGLAGTERNLLTIIEHLDRERFTPYLVSVQDCEFIRGANFPCDTKSLRINRMFTPGYWLARRRLAKRMRNLTIDIVQTFFVEAHLLGGSAAKKAGVQMIVSSRRNIGHDYSLKEKLYLKIANKYPYRFLANSYAVIDTISEIEHLDRDLFVLIHNGVALTANRRDYAQKKASLKVIIIANLRPVKSVQTFVDAANLVHQKLTDVKFVIVGDGPDRSQLVSRVASYGLTNVIEFVGSQHDVASFVDASDIGVNSSIAEGFSNSILEYMRSGLPVVATGVGGNSEIVENGANGFLVPVGDADAMASKLILLLTDPKLREQMGKKGRELVERQLSLEKMVRSYEDFYYGMVSGTFFN